MRFSEDNKACRNDNCPVMMRSVCRRFGKDGRVVNFVPVRNRPDSVRLYCDGFDKKVVW